MAETLADFYKKRDALRFALVSRVLTDEEMAEVESQGELLFAPRDVCYRDMDITTEFNAALLQQFKLRRIAALTTIEDVTRA